MIKVGLLAALLEYTPLPSTRSEQRVGHGFGLHPGER